MAGIEAAIRDLSRLRLNNSITRAQFFQQVKGIRSAIIGLQPGPDMKRLTELFNGNFRYNTI